MTKRIAIRQGDVLVVSGAQIPAVVPVPPENGRVILAHGEHTGHHHSFGHSREVALFREDGSGGGLFLSVTGTPMPLEHQEHSALIVAPGVHEVVRQVQWSDQDEPIQVQD